MTHPATPETEASSPGAVASLAEDPASRKRFLKMVGAGGAGALSLFLAACGSSSKSSSTSTATPASTSTTTGSNAGDIAIVNYALTLEYLEADFYKKVAASGLFKGSDLSVIKTFAAQEQQHVDALTAAVGKLGGTAVAKPQTKFPINNVKGVLNLAATVENLGAAAYLGQAGAIKSKEILAAALAIHTVEARHAAALNKLIGKSPTPDGAFAKPASMAQVLPIAKQFIVA
jgi:rubrerythrin